MHDLAPQSFIPRVHVLRRRLRTAIASGLLAAACLAGVADATALDGTLLEFRDNAYALSPMLQVFRRSVDEPEHLDITWPIDNPASAHHQHIARVRIVGYEGSGESLRYKVEAQPDESVYELCYCPQHATAPQCRSRGTICHELSVGITERSGVLYWVAPANAPWTVFHYFGDFVRQRMELSVSEGDHKVYREVLIEPPEGTPDCSDYPDVDVDRYVCLYQGETNAPAPMQNQAVLAALPGKLVQPKANYELIFAEEFDGNTGRRPAGYCEGGLSNLDGDKWNFREEWCKRADAADQPCENMRDGYYEMGTANFSGCASVIRTQGKFSYKYGYLETQYTVKLDEPHPQVMNLVIGHPPQWLKFAAAKYGVPIRNYEEMSKFLSIEIDLFEYYPERKREQALWFYNYHPYIHYPHTEPRSASHWTRFCEDSGQGVRQLNFFTVAQCEQRTSITVTKGLEWTPRGYRTLVKVKDLHDDFIVVSKESTSVKRWRALSQSTPAQFPSGLTHYTGTARAPFFELLEPGNPDSVLTKFAISHTPLYIHFGNYGYRDDGTSENSVVRERMKIDYVRVFQPRDRYAGMEPVYE